MSRTHEDVRREVANVIDTCVGTYNVAAITDDIVKEHGMGPVDDIPADTFWSVVQRHEES